MGRGGNGRLAQPIGVHMAFWSGEWWIAVIVLAIGFIIWAIWYQVHKHTEGILAAGRGLGLIFVTVPKTFIKSVAKTTHLFSRGGSKKIRLVLEGDFDEFYVRYFDYQYTFGALHAAIIYKQSVAAFPIAGGFLPVFQLRPATSVEKLASKLGYPSLRFDSHQKFSTDYVLQGPDESSIRQLFLPPLLDFFESMPKARWYVDSSGEWLFVYVHGFLVEGAGLVSFLEEACQVAKAVVEKSK